VTAAQLLFKKGMVSPQGSETENPSIIEKYLLNKIYFPALLAGLVLNIIAGFFWLLAYSELDLSLVFPFISLNHILIPIGASIFFKEKLSMNRKIGIGFICLGIFFIAVSY